MLTVYKLVLAETDLISIWTYGFETWGIDQADHYLDSIHKSIQVLAETPYVNRLR